ncbi:hypothetical protein D3C80_1875350 [compost metagenome]
MTEQVDARRANQLIDIDFALAAAIIIGKYKLHILHHAVCEIIASKVRIPVLIGGMNIDVV